MKVTKAKGLHDLDKSLRQEGSADDVRFSLSHCASDTKSECICSSSRTSCRFELPDCSTT